MDMTLRTLVFTAPSGRLFEIREQNGEDEEIITNPVDSKNLMNLTKYISAIVVKTNATKSGRLTIEDALKLPLLDRYCILFNSRIFSLGEEVEFTYKWDNKDSVTYSQDLREFLFDYAVLPIEQEMEEKPNAIPYYLGRKGEDGFTLMQYTEELNSGKVIQFELMDGEKESQMVQLLPSKLTRHSTLLLRNLKLKVDDKFEKVENFSLFSSRDMAEIHRLVNTVDPIFHGYTQIENPETGNMIDYPIMAAPDFFYLTGDII